MDIFKRVKNLNLPLDKYVVVGGSALEGYGVRKSNDIDMCITPDLYEKLKQEEGWIEIVEPDGLRALHKADVEAATKWGYGKYDLSVEELMASSVIINGARFASLQQVLDYKKVTGREKDIRDVKLIEEYIRNHTGSTS